MGGIVNDDGMEQVEDAVRGVMYSAYSLILMQLTAEDEAAADEWLRLTARGMRMNVSALAMQLWLYNREKLGYLEGKFNGGADD